jgi:HSP20 family protein
MEDKMNLIRYNPTRDLWHLRDEMDKIFNQFTTRTFDSEETPEVDWSPRVDITENENSYVVKAELAGLSKDDVKITMKEDVLTIRGEKKSETKSENENVHLLERRYGRFVRAFRLPSSVNSKKIDATFKDGILTLSLPKAEEAKPKEIEIKMN